MQIERSAGNSRRGTRTTWHGSRPTANRRYTRGLTATGTSTCQCCQCLASIGYPHNAITAETRLAPLSRDCCAIMPGNPLYQRNIPGKVARKECQARRSMSARPDARRSSTPVLAMASIRYQAITPLISTPPVTSEIMCTMPRGLTNDTPT